MGICCSIDKDFSKELIEEKPQKIEKEVNYESKPLMTEYEIEFYKKLTLAVPNNYIIQCQIPLSAIIKKVSDYRYANELYRTIDFGIINKSNFEIELLIELNDKTHLEGKRQYRDIKVKEICNKANIPLIAFWSNYENKVDYIAQRIKSYLKN